MLIWVASAVAKIAFEEGVARVDSYDDEEYNEEENDKLADTIRKELENNGVIIEDQQDQTNWKYK